MDLEKAIKILQKEIEPKGNRIAMQLDIQAIEIVLNTLLDLQKDNQNLRNYLSEQKMISNYLKWRKKYDN